jgi:hypothetical protein
MATILFVFFLNILGFNIAGTLLLFTVLFRHYKLWQAAVISVTITVICFMIFRFCFSVPLPLSPFGF